jgi:hypothetical protein
MSLPNPAQSGDDTHRNGFPTYVTGDLTYPFPIGPVGPPPT